MTIFPVSAFNDNYIWVLVNDQQNAIVVDPGDAAPVLTCLNQQGLNLVAIWITHHHYDHTGGIAGILEKYEVPVFGPTLDKIHPINYCLKEKDRISIEGFPEFIVFDIPGHTLGHIAYYGDGSLFCGDTLFAGGCGRLFEGTAEQMVSSLMKMASLPDETNIYCAHEYTEKNLGFAKIIEPYNSEITARLLKVQQQRKAHLPTLPSTLGEEKRTNPFLRCYVPSLMDTIEKQCGKSLPGFVSVFTELRKLKDNY